MSKYIIEVDDNAVANASNCYHIVGTNSVLVSTDGLDGLEKYEETEKTVKELTFPQFGDEYFIICSNGDVDSSTYEEDSYDTNRMSIGNFFRTREEAEFAVERLKVLDEMRKFAEPSDTKWNGNTRHYYICYDIEDKRLRVDNHTLMWGGEICFESDKRANDCIEAVGEDRIKKFYIGVE